ncbi:MULTISPECIES: DUF6708 domain-containing protein [Cobetia]|uniref:DUF6708 domain-containing protein n=1 Tax=Cobetia TaxID=204286 RepID=UPI0011158022|nr:MULTISPECIES: DUF6708 domain-containing protein [Cobetia]
MALPKSRQDGIIPDSYGSLIKLNSTYAEFIDRADRHRGMSKTTFGFLLVALINGLGVFSAIYVGGYIDSIDVMSIHVVTFLIIALILSLTDYFVWKHHLGRDFLTVSFYPIRFNRKKRMVYIYRDRESGGVLKVNWNDIFWHIGKGYQQEYNCDLRGHVMKNGVIVDTFSVGNFYDDSRVNQIMAMWEFIRRYMEEPLDSLFDEPLDRHIDKSTEVSLKNCYMHVYANMWPFAIDYRYYLAPVFYPLLWILTLGRWFTLGTCKKPVWPSSVEAECIVVSDDPMILQEPKYTGEFSEDPAVADRQFERHSQQRKYEIM